MDSLGSMDGAGRIVAGSPALVLGIDQIADERSVLPLRVFLTHELFHRFHSQVAGFSDDPGDRQAIWRTLWAEGLATYMSYRLTPDATINDALMLPSDLMTSAQPHLREIASDILSKLDAPDPTTYHRYFTYGDESVRRMGLPWRSGYYLGFLLARNLGESNSLGSLARMKGPALQAQLAVMLKSLIRDAASKDAAGARVQ